MCPGIRLGALSPVTGYHSPGAEAEPREGEAHRVLLPRLKASTRNKTLMPYGSRNLAGRISAQLPVY